MLRNQSRLHFPLPLILPVEVALRGMHDASQTHDAPSVNRAKVQKKRAAARAAQLSKVQKRRAAEAAQLLYALARSTIKVSEEAELARCTLRTNR